MEKIKDIVKNMVEELQQKTKETKTDLMIKQEEGKDLRVEQNVLDFGVAFNTTKEEQKKRYAIRKFNNEQYIRIEAPVISSGLMKIEDLTILLGCFLLLKHAYKRPDKYTVETSYKQIFELLLLPDNGDNWKFIKEGLERLKSNQLETNFWWDTINGKRVIQSNFQFIDLVKRTEEGYLRIRLNKEIVDSMEKGYLKVLEESRILKIIKLRGYAKILSLFFLKRLGGDVKKTFTVEFILEILGLRENYKKYRGWERNIYIKMTIIPSIEKAAEVLGYGIKIFVQDFKGEDILVYPQRQKGKHYPLILAKIAFEKKHHALVP